MWQSLHHPIGKLPGIGVYLGISAPERTDKLSRFGNHIWMKLITTQFKDYHFPAKIIQYAVWLCNCLNLRYCDIDETYESIQYNNIIIY